MKRYFNILFIVALGLIVSSCDDFFDVDPGDSLDGDDYPGSVTELYSGYMGVTAKVQAVADKAIFLEGLRGDFLEPTRNATDDMIDLYNYNPIKKDNQLANPVGYYDAILNANDYIKNATEFFEKNPTSLDQATFDALISGVLRYKCWAYLMLAKIYGEAVWIDDPLIEYQDISKYPTLGFKEVIGNCINLIEKGIVITDFRGEEHVISGKMRVRWTEILNNTDLVWNRYCPPAEALLTELYLFDEQYDNAIQSGFAMLRIGAEDSQTKPSFQITKTEWKGEWLSLFGSFTRTEAIFIIQYDYDQKQTNHLMEYFSNDPANKYYLKPTQVTIDRYKNETGDDGSAGDKYRGFSNDGVNGKTVKMENGEWVVWKYTAARSSADKIYRNDAPITLYRAPDIHLWLAEALVYKGRLEEAVVAFYDGGIESYYDKESGMFTGKFSDFPATLYSSSSDGSCMGIRGRAGLLKKGGDIIKNPSANIEDDQRKIINLLIEETCMESAGEARALYAMLRAAKRWNDPSFVADKVSAKYPDGKKQEMKNKLQNSENWFIKYNLK